MAVSLRATGTWAELIADGSVAIPTTPQAGDRMYLFARWKDFSVTATVANWTAVPGTPFADGSVTAGNGTGSVKVGCWYRDWQSGDTDPTIDFSASPDNASAVIMVMQKAVDDVWTTPVARTAAMTTWTTTSQTVSASANVAVPSGGVVMGLIGIRDDTATMTRPTSGIDDSAGAVTWNGNYVESPATHHSTTTGFDGAADLGYRLVTTGATATLRMTGTIAAAETGAALWVIQGTIIVVTPAPASLTLTTFAPTIGSAVTPETANFELSTFTPTLRTSVIPSPALFEIATLAPLLGLSVVPAPASFVIATSTPSLLQSITPATVNLSISTFSPSLTSTVTPAPQSLTITVFTPTLVDAVIPETLSLVLTTFAPSIWPPNIIYLDPGGDAVQAPGYFAAIDGAGTATFDATQQIAGVGSWKFDSGAGTSISNTVAGALGAMRRFSVYFRYDSIPDQFTERSEFIAATATYSGGGLLDADFNLVSDNGAYATATPERNSGQGSVCVPFSPLLIPANAIIDWVKITYERKYDTDTSIGVSRVKWVLGGVEGPDHDNTDMPLTDTVVEVDVTNDRFWEPQDFGAGFEIVIEARRGDTDTAHTQSWDYAKVEVVYHTASVILAAMDGSNHTLFTVGLNPKGDRSVFRFTDGDGNSFDGISPLFVNTWNRISVGYVLNAADDLEIKIYVNSIEELSIEQASTGGFSPLFTLRYGWVTSPGANHLCWFDQIYIDDGDDLSDTGNKLMTAKLPASVNEDEWDTVVGTGAVNERPLSETNLRRHNAATSKRQTYTLQAADQGDVDLTGKTLVGYMAWAWAKMQIEGDEFFLVANGIEVNRTSQIKSTPSLLKHAVTSYLYPSDVAGVGARTNEEGIDTYLYELGAVVAYEGPIINAPLFLYQLLAEDSVTPVTDDLRSDLPDTYELLLQVSESGAQVSVEVYAITFEGQEPQRRDKLDSGGGSVRVPIHNPGIELTFVITVMGGNAYVGLRRRLNV